jgi:amino acid transporter
MGATEHGLSDDKATPMYSNEKTPVAGSDAELGEHNIEGHIELVETTKRGLKARHAQMIALGGTIGM